MKTITVSRLKDALEYFPDTGFFVWKIKLSPRAQKGSIAGSSSHDGYRRIRIDNQEYKSHRLAWLYVHGEWPKYEIDHINGNKIDNRLCNLREATRKQNRANSKPTGSSAGLKGVTWHSGTKKWQAIIGLNGKNIYLGLFESPMAAHFAYSRAAHAAHGEFARTS